MPLTPFHFGPGTLAKSVAPRWFSLRAFLLSQVVIDCETAWNIYRGHERLHTFFHSYLGVSLAMFLTWLLLFAYNVIAQLFPKMWLIRELEDWGEPFQLWPSAIAVLFGGWSHVFLDSLMHADMQPLAPFSDANVMLDWISLEMLHMACLLSFGGAALVWGIQAAYRQVGKASMARRKD